MITFSLVELPDIWLKVETLDSIMHLSLDS